MSEKPKPESQPMDDVLRRMLAMPPAPRRAPKKKRKKPAK
jgi:hypothetical protein